MLVGYLSVYITVDVVPPPYGGEIPDYDYE